MRETERMRERETDKQTEGGGGGEEERQFEKKKQARIQRVRQTYNKRMLNWW